LSGAETSVMLLPSNPLRQQRFLSTLFVERSRNHHQEIISLGQSQIFSVLLFTPRKSHSLPEQAWVKNQAA